MGKAKRIVDGKRNANVPVDMSDHFYDHGNEYCRYLITDPSPRQPLVIQGMEGSAFQAVI